MKVIIKNRPSGAYDGALWPEVGESIDLPDHIAEGMLRDGFVVKPTTNEAKEAKAEAAARAKVEKAEAEAQAKVDAAEKAAEKAQAKVETATDQAKVETAKVKTTPKK